MVKVYVKLQYTHSIQVHIMPIVKTQLQEGLPSVQHAVNKDFCPGMLQVCGPEVQQVL